jgi:hypothetical protein
MDILSHLPHGITADVVGAKYSKADLHAARQRLLRNGAPMDLTVSGSAKPIRITEMAPALDGNSLEIGYDEDLGVGHRVLRDALSPTSRADVTSEVAASASRITGVAVTPTYKTIGVDLSSRGNDTSPWYGSAALLNPGGGVCSSGFGFNSSSGYLITTAYHCGASGVWHTWNGGSGGAMVGSADGGSPGDDTTPIWVNVSGHSLYDGPSLPDSSYAKDVTSWGHNNAGDPVCVDGANSGVHCYAHITLTDIGKYGPNGIWRPDVDQVVGNTSGQVVSVDGDSGGPVFAGVNNWTSDQARGMISMNDYYLSTNCYPELQTGKDCYNATYFVPVYTVMTHNGWTLNIA